MRSYSLAAMTLLMLSPVVAQTQSSSKTQVLGKLGQTVESVRIHSRPSKSSSVYYRAKAYEYLILRPSKYPGWAQVVMQDLRAGFIKLDSVARLPYDVTLDQTRMAKPVRSSSASLGSINSREDVARVAQSFRGTPYVWGGNNLIRGIDCSGFVQQLFGKIGVNLPRTAAEQALVGTPITQLEDLKVGDRLYFWERKRNKVGHTGIYIGNGYFVHSSRRKGGVDTDYLSERWRKILVAARR
jgi:cell wall-associated NlpC family hydrolase